MLTNEEVIELEKNIEEMQLRLRKHRIEELLHKYSIECGEKLAYLGKIYQILDMGELMEYNRTNPRVRLYGKLIKKNGEFSVLVHELYGAWIEKKSKNRLMLYLS